MKFRVFPLLRLRAFGMDAEEALALIDELDAVGESASELDGDIDPSEIDVLSSSEEDLLDRHLLGILSCESE